MNDFTRTAGNSPVPAAPSSERSSLFVYAVIAIGLALCIRFFIAAPYIVSGASMEPTFDNFHYLIIDRISYDIGEPVRGDVIVFDLPQNSSRALIKRVIGVPGDTVSIRDSVVYISNAANPDGFMLDEPYLDPANIGGVANLEVTLGTDQYFVLGDNRKVSADSRIWGILPRENIAGRVLIRLFPFTDIALFPGNARYNE